MTHKSWTVADFWGYLEDLLNSDHPRQACFLPVLFEDLGSDLATEIHGDAVADPARHVLLLRAFAINIGTQHYFDKWMWLSTPEGRAEHDRMWREFAEESERLRIERRPVTVSDDDDIPF